VVATERILEGNILPPSSSAISKPERKGAIFSQTEPIITKSRVPTITGKRLLEKLLIYISSFIQFNIYEAKIIFYM
jgi:hypothetical protein